MFLKYETWVSCLHTMNTKVPKGTKFYPFHILGYDGFLFDVVMQWPDLQN